MAGRRGPTGRRAAPGRRSARRRTHVAARAPCGAAPRTAGIPPDDLRVRAAGSSGGRSFQRPPCNKPLELFRSVALFVEGRADPDVVPKGASAPRVPFHELLQALYQSARLGQDRARLRQISTARRHLVHQAETEPRNIAPSGKAADGCPAAPYPNATRGSTASR